MRIGIDLGGTKIAGVVLDDCGAAVAQRRVATPTGDYRGTVVAVAALVRGLEVAVGRDGLRVGVGTPGTIQPDTGRIKNANSVCLNGQRLQQDLEAALGRRLRLANDADCLAVSEAADGAGAGAACVFAVILGTGVGGGLVVNGKLITGPNGISGEWGHNPLPWPDAAHELPGPACWCGRHGCLETWLSGAALAAEYQRRGHPRVDAAAVAARAASGDTVAHAAVAAYGDRLARGLATVINILDPAVIVLGGGLSRITGLYAEVPARWGAYVFSNRVATRLLPAAHGDASGVRGAAWLWD